MPALDRTEAVNLMLSAVGEQEVTAAEVTTPTDAAVKKATRVIDDANRQLQLWGWSFNRERNVTLTPVAGKIVLDADVIHVDPSSGNGQYAMRRDGVNWSLYDRYNNTFVFSGEIKVELHRLIDFDDIPMVAQELVTRKAAATFAEHYLGEPQPSLQRDAAMAEAQFFDVESEMSDLRLSDSFDVWRTSGRQSPLDGYGG